MKNASQIMESNEYDVNSKMVLTLAKESSLSAYDCEFIASAKDIRVKLVTADQRIALIFPEHTLALQKFI